MDLEAVVAQGLTTDVGDRAVSDVIQGVAGVVAVVLMTEAQAGVDSAGVEVQGASDQVEIDMGDLPLQEVAHEAMNVVRISVDQVVVVLGRAAVTAPAQDDHMIVQGVHKAADSKLKDVFFCLH